MPRAISVYKLERYHDDPRFEGSFSNYLWKRIPMPGYGRKDGRPTKFTPIWVRAKASGRVRKFNDFPGLNGMPAFSSRAVDALNEFLEPNGELLPFKTPLGEYFAYNILTMVDALDAKRSKIDRFGITGEQVLADHALILPAIQKAPAQARALCPE